MNMTAEWTVVLERHKLYGSISAINIKQKWVYSDAAKARFKYVFSFRSDGGIEITEHPLVYFCMW
jgi:hypothetical protein